MSILLRRHFRNLIKKCQPVRHGMFKGAYEGDGKTTMTILNRDMDYGIMIDAITPVGFRLNVGMFILGPMIVFPRTIISWNIQSSSEIHEDSLALFKVMMPRPDIIVFGMDDDYPRDSPLIIDFRRVMKKLNMNVEILPVDKACTTFNFLNAERRFVVGVFLPPKAIKNLDILKLQEVSERKALDATIHKIKK